MDVVEQVLALQKSYPQVFHACHTEHVRRPTTPWRVSPSDGSVLAHLDARHGVRPGELAIHMGLSPSSLSATIARLQRLGYVARARSGLDVLARGARALLAERGSAARWTRSRKQKVRKS